MTNTNILGRHLLVATATLTVFAVISAATAQATGPAAHHQFQTLCEAGDGTFALARFDTYRCQGARTDGIGVFWPERTACERAAGRSFFEAVVESGSLGTWLCVPALPPR